jgi:prepilin-type processing-associated H-X9-DG protein
MSERCDAEYTHSDLANSTYLGRAWISGWAPTAPTYMHLKPPNTNHCHFGHSFTTGDFIVTPSSHHAGGVNVAFADGHVEFIADDVDQEVWWSMGSRNGRDSAIGARK